MRLRSWILLLLLTGLPGLAPAPARSQEIDTINIATGGIALFNYLPVVLAERIGAFKKENLKVEVNDFQGGQRSVEALVGGSVDVAIATYENVPLLQTKGVTLVTAALINRSIGAVIAVTAKNAPNVKEPKDVKGFAFGVSSVGSATHRILNLYLGKGGLTSNDVSIHGLGGGAGALALIKSGRIDGFVHSEPVVSQALKDGTMKVLVDGRTEAGMKYLYGGYIAATIVLTTPSFIEKKPRVLQKFVNAMVATLMWMQTATPDEITATVPAEYVGPDKAMYRDAIALQIPIFSADGILHRDELERTIASMRSEGQLKPDQKVDLNKTYDTRFAAAANQK
ncbi:MAG: sulfonate transport system substrate-binding protein [Alphaproteobacteria bacterium]|nr:sulfonate transport system substrate-binding protein [Alphaproteobacteria bacterium]